MGPDNCRDGNDAVFRVHVWLSGKEAADNAEVEETPLPPPVEITPGPCMPADVPNRPLTAAEAALIALKHQPSVGISRQAIVSAQGVEDQARSGLLPVLGLSASYSASGTAFGVFQQQQTITPTSGVAPGVAAMGLQLTATLRQLIYDFTIHPTW